MKHVVFEEIVRGRNRHPELKHAKPTGHTAAV